LGVSFFFRLAASLLARPAVFFHEGWTFVKRFDFQVSGGSWRRRWFAWR
jgi:hypothetical protein